MNLLYRITHTIVLWIFPVLLVISSFVVMVPASSQHKAAISYDNFYGELSKILQNPPSQSTYSAEAIILRATLSDLATPQWLQSITETNVDNFVNWLDGKNENWEIYIPSNEVQKSASQSVDKEVEKILDDPNTKIEPCNSEKSQQIRKSGLSLDTEFCLPPSVISGEETLTEFMGIKDANLEENFFSSFLSQNPLTSDTIQADQTFAQSGLVNSLNTVRTSYQWLKNTLPLIWGIFIAFTLAHLLIAKAADRTFLGQLQRILFLTGINTIILSIIVIMFVAGSNYLSSSVIRFVFPGLAITQIQNMILLRVVLVVTGLLQLAIITGVSFIIIRVLLSILKNMGMIGSVAEKNKRLTSSQGNIRKNPTMDGEFKRQIENQRNESNDSIKLAGISSITPGQKVSDDVRNSEEREEELVNDQSSKVVEPAISDEFNYVERATEAVESNAFTASANEEVSVISDTLHDANYDVGLGEFTDQSNEQVSQDNNDLRTLNDAKLEDQKEVEVDKIDKDNTPLPVIVAVPTPQSKVDVSKHQSFKEIPTEDVSPNQHQDGAGLNSETVGVSDANGEPTTSFTQNQASPISSTSTEQQSTSSLTSQKPLIDAGPTRKMRGL